MSGIERRDFFKGIAVAGLGVVGSGLISGCTPQPNTSLSQNEETNRAKSQTSSSEQARQAISQLNPQDYEFTSNTTDFSTLFSPLEIGNLKLSNRMVKSSAGSNTFKPGEESAVAYYSSFVKGGIDLTFVECACSGLPHFPSKIKTPIEQRRPSMEAVVQAIHNEGGYVGFQIDTMGIEPYYREGASLDVTADVLTLEEVKTLVQDYVDYAKVIKEMGFDIIEINAAANNLPQAFLSRFRNKREDEYGGQSLENRTRFLTEIIQGIKSACGTDWPVQVLINGIEENDSNLGDNALFNTVEDGIAIAKILEGAGISSLHVRLGPNGMHIAQFAGDVYFAGRGIEGSTGYGTQFDFDRHYQGKLVSNHSGAGLMLNIAKEYKDALSIPVGCVTFNDPAYAPDYFEDALRKGMCDFYLMNRPLNVEPEYANKLKSGRLDEIAPCTRCLHCYSDMTLDGESIRHCRVNATTQRAFFEGCLEEGYALPACEDSKKVMVVGAGPAGLEAARIAALRGHNVTLYEKKSSVGGLLSFASAIKGQHEHLDSLRQYLSRQLELTGVTLVTNTEVDEAFIKEQSPDAVVLAVGGLRDTLGIESTAGTNVVPIDTIIEAEIGENVTIVGGNAQAVDIALYLLEQGKKISMVFSDPIDHLAKGQSYQTKSFVIPMLYARGVRIWPESKLTSIGDGEVIVNRGDAGVEVSYSCETVIEAMDMRPNDEIAKHLSGTNIFAIGDCSDPFNILMAIQTGNLAGRKI